jgi:hypothetical protein
MQTDYASGISGNVSPSTYLIIGVSVVIGIAIIGGAISGAILARKRKFLETHLKSLRGFRISQHFIGMDGEAAIGLDESLKCICILHRNKGDVKTHIYSHHNLISSEIFEDGSTITQTSRSSQVGGILTGGLLMGKTGALIGGLSANTESEQKVKQVDLRITVYDMSNPVHDIAFLFSASLRQGAYYQLASGEVRKWHALLSILIREAESQQGTPAPHQGLPTQ